MTPTDILIFAGTAALLVISPGPNAALIAKTVPGSGRRAGVANVCGFVTAFYLHGALAIFGVSILLVRSSQLYSMVKLAGALYLVFLGVLALRSAWQLRGLPGSDEAPTEVGGSGGRHFLEGLMTNALNPKVSVFYLAAFPQFIPDGSSVAAPILLVVVHSAINAVWFSSLVLVFGRIAAAARTVRFKRRIQAATGVVFVGFGGRLAATD